MLTGVAAEWSTPDVLAAGLFHAPQLSFSFAC